MSFKHLLIVSENDALQEKIKTEFKDEEITATWAKDPHLAMEMMSAKEYYAAIVYVDLTAVSSYDLLYKLSILRHSVPVIAISSELTADDILLGYDFGVIDIIDKNFSEGELLGVLKKISNVEI